MPKLSVIIPTLNEEENPYFFKIIELLLSYEEIEVIVSDGGSVDDTFAYCSKLNIIFLSNKTTSRAERINFGIRESSCEMILLQHPRSLICKEGVEYLLKNMANMSWGGFSHSFDSEHPILKFTSWYSNYIRGSLSSILYLDHCIFLKKSMAVSIGEIPIVDIFEDTILSQKLRKKFGKPKILPHKVTTSAFRFKTNGILRQSLINQYLKIKFYLGADHCQMNRLYERNTRLNSKYDIE
ncbi:MAG: glycosyltransferase [Bdellovibrionales bacterium]|jgi:glycosyltransferase involved in cell wall biosynthesis|nr:glycosyltransferase [Bdellovibrionales bacterium]